MGIGNGVVRALLESPAHRLLSGSTDVVRYTGRRSGTTHATPTQYAEQGDDLVILVGHPETKTWWRNFRQGGDLDVLVRGCWHPMTGRAVTAADEPEEMARLLSVYLARFPKAARHVGQDPLVVWCRPRVARPGAPYGVGPS